LGLLKKTASGVPCLRRSGFAQAGRQFSVLTYWQYAPRANNGHPLRDAANNTAAFPSAKLKAGLDEPFDKTLVMLFLNCPEASEIQRSWGPICPWELLLFNTPIFDLRSSIERRDRRKPVLSVNCGHFFRKEIRLPLYPLRCRK